MTQLTQQKRQYQEQKKMNTYEKLNQSNRDQESLS